MRLNTHSYSCSLRFAVKLISIVGRKKKKGSSSGVAVRNLSRFSKKKKVIFKKIVLNSQVL